MWAALIPVIATVMGSIMSNLNKQSNQPNSSSGSGLNTEQIPRFTPEQEEMFKRLMAGAKNRAFVTSNIGNQGPRVAYNQSPGLPQQMRPGAVQNAFSQFGG